MRVAVVVPSYRRPEFLRRCLEALSSQTEPAEEIVVVRRADDAGTAVLLKEWPQVNAVEVDLPGVLAAMHVGVGATGAEIIAFTDDDAAPGAYWLATLRRHLDDPAVGAVGGRDVVSRPSQLGSLTECVGHLNRWGQVTGNHHLGIGPARDVAILKGVNMAFRRAALSLPTGLRGTGAQVDFELACCVAAAADGWRLVYDPSAQVDHNVGPRFDSDRRGRRDPTAVSDAAYNRLAILLSLKPTIGLRRAVFGLLIGERATPGLLRAVVAAARRESEVLRLLPPSWSGQLAALGAVARGNRVRMVPLMGQEIVGARPFPSTRS